MQRTIAALTLSTVALATAEAEVEEGAAAELVGQLQVQREQAPQQRVPALQEQGQARVLLPVRPEA